MNQYCVGIDVGGTSVKCGIFTYNGVLLDKWEVLTRKAEQGKYILPDVAEELKKHLAEKTIAYEDVAGIGNRCSRTGRAGRPCACCGKLRLEGHFIRRKS